MRVVQPRLRLPKRAGGLALAGRALAPTARTADVLWVNDATVGVHLLRLGIPTVYDVTDDWRHLAQSDRARNRWIRAEDRLARAARTVVCSEELASRWQARYGVSPVVIQNGVDLQAVQQAKTAAPRALPGRRPHLGYVGTLHDDRLDVELVERLARESEGTVHLVGPDALTVASRDRLRAAGARLHGPVASTDVPRWLVSMDVLLCPHTVSDFTLSLDAIKAHEYLATGKPIVATPTSGFQHLRCNGVSVAHPGDFVDAVGRAAADQTDHGPREAVDWDTRAAQFAAQLLCAARPPR